MLHYAYTGTERPLKGTGYKDTVDGDCHDIDIFGFESNPNQNQRRVWIITPKNNAAETSRDLFLFSVVFIICKFSDFK